MQLCLYFASDNIKFRNGENKCRLVVLCFTILSLRKLQKEQTQLKKIITTSKLSGGG